MSTRIEIPQTDSQGRFVMTPAPPMICAGCGCDEQHACVVDGVACHWVATDGEQYGLCSVCAVKPLEELIR
ncbi:MAG TPA: hypothetical protein VND65_17990 [Candidatus Binatia bacterium]|nr:hypothetical protein [Candidatus Binatia bacterium]